MILTKTAHWMQMRTSFLNLTAATAPAGWEPQTTGFNNEGFAAFTAKNGALENGDEIHIMYDEFGRGHR